jgi:hypothetical protein
MIYIWGNVTGYTVDLIDVCATAKYRGWVSAHPVAVEDIACGIHLLPRLIRPASGSP